MRRTWWLRQCWCCKRWPFAGVYYVLIEGTRVFTCGDFTCAPIVYAYKEK